MSDSDQEIADFLGEDDASSGGSVLDQFYNAVKDLDDTKATKNDDGTVTVSQSGVGEAAGGAECIFEEKDGKLYAKDFGGDAYDTWYLTEQGEEVKLQDMVDTIEELAGTGESSWDEEDEED